MPWRHRRYIGRSVTSAPSRTMRPLSGCSRPTTMSTDVVLLPHLGVAEQQKPLLVVVVLGPTRRAGSTVLGHDLHVPRRDDAQHALALVVQVDLHPISRLR